MRIQSTSILAVLALAPGAMAGTTISLTQISTDFNSPIGIDYHEPTQSVIASVNYSGGSPYNFERINFDGSHSQFSAVAGLTEELKIATVRSGNPQFTTGTLFSGTGGTGEILKVLPDGSGFSAPWVTLPGGDGLMRGSLYVDRSGVYGGDLITVTTGGQVWRVNAAGTPSLLADVDTHLEGLMTVPNDSAKYGPIAGKIIAGAEDQGKMYVFDANGLVTSYSLGVNIEDIDLIGAGENFFGVNFGSGKILGAPASEFASIAGDILLTQETHNGSGLYRLSWDGSALSAEALDLAQGSAIPAQWEHVTFAPAGIREIPPTTAPDGGMTALLLAMSAGGLAWARRKVA